MYPPGPLLIFPHICTQLLRLSAHAVCWGHGSGDREPLLAKLVWRAVAPPRAGFPFFIFFLNFFFQQFFLYISYVYNSSLWKKLCTQLEVYKKLCTQVVKEKIYTQVILQVVMHTSYTHKNQTLYLKII
jgi:hypothetical protein